MVFISAILSFVFGLLVAIILSITNEHGLKPNRYIYKAIDVVVNTVRSTPFIILTVSIIPFTRLIAGTSIGRTAAIVPLTVTGIPFLARIIENSLNEVNRELIEAALSFGASNFQIVFKIMIPEAIPSIVSGVTLAIISLLNSSAMAGAIGAGGLGAVALIYGHQHFNNTIMYTTLVVIVLLVQIIQNAGNFIYKRVK